MNFPMWLEESIWGKGNVPPYIARQISEDEYRRAKQIVYEVESAERAKEYADKFDELAGHPMKQLEKLTITKHKGHYQCTDVDCIL